MEYFSTNSTASNKYGNITTTGINLKDCSTTETNEHDYNIAKLNQEVTLKNIEIQQENLLARKEFDVKYETKRDKENKLSLIVSGLESILVANYYKAREQERVDCIKQFYNLPEVTELINIVAEYKKANTALQNRLFFQSTVDLKNKIDELETKFMLISQKLGHMSTWISLRGIDDLKDRYVAAAPTDLIYPSSNTIRAHLLTTPNWEELSFNRLLELVDINNG